MNTKPILYDLGIALSSVSLWLTPWDITRAAGYSLTMLFSGRAYYTGLVTLQQERRNDEKEAITYEAEVDFYDQLLGSNVEAALEVKALEVETRMLERMIPLVRQKTQLESQLRSVSPVHPEMTDEDKEQVARQAIDNAFTAPEPKQIDEETIRKVFPEETDSINWKGCLKALQGGASKEEIVKDVLGCNSSNASLGAAYYELLKAKFL